MAKKMARRKKPPAHEIAIVGEIFDEGESDFVRSLLDAPIGGEVTLYIDSSGGSVYAALTVCGLIRYRKLRATAVVLGECSSSALLIFAACRRRLVSPRSVFLFHRVRWRSEKDVRSEEAVNWASHFQWLENEVDRYQSELMGVGAERMAQWTAEGRFVLGSELAEIGVAELVHV